MMVQNGTMPPILLLINNYMKIDLTANANNLITNRLLKTKEAAHILAISEATLYRLTSNRKIFAHKIGGSIRFSKKDIADYLEKTGIKPIDSY